MSQDPRIAGLEKYIDDLSEKSGILYKQLGATLNDADKPSLWNQIERCDHEIERAQQKLNALQLTAATFHHQHMNIQDHVCKIDFEEAWKRFHKVCRQLSPECCAALFLMENFSRLGGKWFVQRLRKSFEIEIGKCRDYVPIELSLEMQPNAGGIFRRLAEPFGIEPLPEDAGQCAQKIIERLCKSIRSGEVIFLELHGWDNLAAQDRAFQQFLDEFWLPLIRQLSTIRNYRGFKILLMISTGGKMPPHWRTLCSKNIVELPLKKWTQTHIRQLCECARLPVPTIDRWVPRIYERSGGIPRDVRPELLHYLEQQ